MVAKAPVANQEFALQPADRELALFRGNVEHGEDLTELFCDSPQRLSIFSGFG